MRVSRSWIIYAKQTFYIWNFAFIFAVGCCMLREWNSHLFDDVHKNRKFANEKNKQFLIFSKWSGFLDWTVRINRDSHSSWVCSTHIFRAQICAEIHLTLFCYLLAYSPAHPRRWHSHDVFQQPNGGLAHSTTRWWRYCCRLINHRVVWPNISATR